jgi:hypothetical protein
MGANDKISYLIFRNYEFMDSVDPLEGFLP